MLLAVISLWFCGSFAQAQSAKPKAQAGQRQSDNVAEVDDGQHVGIERAFSRLRFNRPVYLTGAGDGSGRLFVVEHAGIVRWFPQTEENPVSRAFLDISDRVSRRGNEEGLSGFAFHPKFKENGFVFCHYSSDRQRTGDKDVASSIVSRFKISDDPNVVDPTSEKILLTIPQPFENHNGGAMAFGKDGYLYFSLGDGGNANDPMGNGQNLSSMHGAINRINVDMETNGKPYGVPTDNPFVIDPQAAPELFAIGFRNVWRFSFDRKTGELWAGDVGQQRIEEVDIVQKGGNYGWNRYEGNDDFAKETKLAIERHDKPVASYGHEWGGSITGGNVYRGKLFPVLDGSYFFGDYMSGNLWRTRKDKTGIYETELVRRTGRSIASFGEDDEGEVFLLSFDGGIYRIVPTDKPEDTFKEWPVKLSGTGLYTSLATPSPAKQVAYEVNAPFWSDNAEKSRFFVLPEGKSLGYRSNGSWEVPVGTTLVKEFKITIEGRKRILETRLIKRTDDGWEAATYVWDKQGKDAELQPNGKQVEIGGLRTRQSWHAPSSSECASCHVDAAGYVLGLSTAQLNRDSADGKLNQIEDWVRKGFVSLPGNVNLETENQFCSPYYESAELEARARVWLDVNCAMCHQPEGPGNANIDLRYATSLEGTNMIGVRPAQGDLGIVDAKLIAPGHPERSLMVHRIETLGQGRMPMIGSNLVDRKAVKLLNEWIRSMR